MCRLDILVDALIENNHHLATQSLNLIAPWQPEKDEGRNKIFAGPEIVRVRLCEVFCDSAQNELAYTIHNGPLNYTHHLLSPRCTWTFAQWLFPKSDANVWWQSVSSHQASHQTSPMSPNAKILLISQHLIASNLFRSSLIISSAKTWHADLLQKHKCYHLYEPHTAWIMNKSVIVLS